MGNVKTVVPESFHSVHAPPLGKDSDSRNQNRGVAKCGGCGPVHKYVYVRKRAAAAAVVY